MDIYRRSVFGAILVLSGQMSLVKSQQCYEYRCTGTGCLTEEATTNPLLITKCDRLIYKGCYTITTSFTGFSTTTTGCIDREFECRPGQCSSLTSVTEVTCCNSDLCNDGRPTSSAALVQPWVTLIVVPIFSLLFVSSFFSRHA